MVTKKVRYKDSKGKVYEYDIGAKAENVEEDVTRRFASDAEKEKWNGKIGADTQIEFTEASDRQNINTKETIETILGKVKKFFTDLKPHAFYDLVQNATTAAVDRAVSAAVAKNLQDQINAQNTNINNLSLSALKKRVHAGSASTVPVVLDLGHSYIVVVRAIGSVSNIPITWVGFAYCSKADGSGTGIIPWYTNSEGGTNITIAGNTLMVYCGWSFEVIQIELN